MAASSALWPAQISCAPCSRANQTGDALLGSGGIRLGQSLRRPATVSSRQSMSPMREPLRIVVPVDGSAPATRAVAHALSVVAGQPGAEIFLVNVQNLRTLDISDISAVMTVEVDRPAASGTPI